MIVHRVCRLSQRVRGLAHKREINLFFPPAKSDRSCGVNGWALMTYELLEATISIKVT